MKGLQKVPRMTKGEVLQFLQNSGDLQLLYLGGLPVTLDQEPEVRAACAIFILSDRLVIFLAC